MANAKVKLPEGAQRIEAKVSSDMLCRFWEDGFTCLVVLWSSSIHDNLKHFPSRWLLPTSAGV